MKVRIKKNNIVRSEKFGSSIYVPERDDIFLLDLKTTNKLKNISARWSTPSKEVLGLKTLAELGIIEATNSNGDALPQRSHSGVHLLGEFATTPLVEKPLLVNCFSTAWCPLKCVYCHADDLMDIETRQKEEPEQVCLVANVATQLDALVYVITGGDPLTRPERALALIGEIPENSAVVLDTSGVGDIADLERILQSRKIHLRVSIDSMNPKINNKLRPINKKYFADLAAGGVGSLDYAERALEIGGELATGVSVQTVVTKHNDSLEHLLNLRDWLYSRGVRNWVLHIAANAGLANKVFVANKKKFGSEVHAGIFPAPKVSKVLQSVVKLTQTEGINMDIRTTNASPSPNSVFLVGSVGTLFVQSYATGKATKEALKLTKHEMTGMWGTFSDAGHVSRYTNLDIASGHQSLTIESE